MYGTVAHLQIKRGAEQQLAAEFGDSKSLGVPGYVGSTVYRMDNDPTHLILVVMFESKEAYEANASSPDQDERFRKMMALLTAEPQWNDGEIVFSDLGM